MTLCGVCGSATGNLIIIEKDDPITMRFLCLACYSAESYPLVKLHLRSIELADRLAKKRKTTRENVIWQALRLLDAVREVLP